MNIYKIFLGEQEIGFTYFENSDFPMGVVFGSIQFNEHFMGYQFLKEYCLNYSIELVSDSPEDEFIATRTIPQLKILNESGFLIEGIGNQIIGLNSEGFEINIEGIPSTLFKKEFPHHVKIYEELFG